METDRVGELESRLAQIERRLSVLEGAARERAELEPEALGPMLGEGTVSNASTHLGRILLIFGGAYLLRAITDGQFVPTALGILLGAGYAVFWLYQAFRKAGSEGQRATAVFFGASSVLLVMPLIVEAVSRFKLLSGRQAIVALAVYSALVLGVAARRNLGSLVWLVTAGATGTAVAILMAARVAEPAAAFLFILALCVLWLRYACAWKGVQWLAALGCNAGILSLALLSRSEQWTVSAGTAIVFAGVALAAYLLSFAVQTHWRGGRPGAFEVVQALSLIGIAVATIAIAPAIGRPDPAWIGSLSLLLGAGAYALALTGASRATRGARYYYYSGLGLVLVIAGTALALPVETAALLWAIMAIFMAWSSGRQKWVSLSLQCSLLIIAAGIGSGILADGMQALAGDAAVSWPSPNPWHAGIAMATVVCLFLPVAQSSDRWGKAARLPQLTVLALSVWEVGGLLVTWFAPLLAIAGDAEPDLALLAALRTAVLSAAAVTLALSSRHRRWPEARWLVYPVLVLVGIKLFVEDFPHGKPASLFVALVFVGGALLLAAKLLSGTANQGLPER